MCGLDELQAAVLVERDVPSSEFDFEQVGVMAGAEEHCLLLQPDALLYMLEHPIADGPGLFRFVHAGEEHGRLFALAIGPEVLRVAEPGRVHYRIGRVEYGLD
jgi:hypothetical protein